MPISLLELNTLGHAICMLLIYSLWWNKPFGVDYPTIVKDQILWDIRALRFMRSDQSPVVESYVEEIKPYDRPPPDYRLFAKIRPAVR